MKTFNLSGALRTETGKKAAKQFRKEGLIPAVLYGGENVVHFSVKQDDIRKLVFSPDIHVVDLAIDGKNVKAVLKEVQFHPVSDKVLHIDFLEVFDNKPIQMAVPVVLEGLAEGVKAGGKLTLEKRKLRVKAVYSVIPEQLKVDVTNLGIGKSLQVGQLSFENLEVTEAKNAVVCSVKLTRAARGAAAKAE
ncbi:MAG: 50S ribosomal protein L25/general stress protein Ctc [Bacteroidales bacterium]|nr:50S ribosomal protein L25/general stress protein Ctc [Bacteroidales bacterium]